MSVVLPACPSCHCEEVVKNGRTRHSKQNYKCRDCGRQFVEDPQWRAISEETKGIIDRLVLEKLSQRRHCSCLANLRVVGATIDQCPVQASVPGGATLPKAERSSDGADG